MMAEFANGDAGKLYFDLGRYHRPVSTTSGAAQLWFNRGLIWCYGFNHEEAAVCFERSIAADPECVLAYWGLAYALGPNYNKSWESFDREGLDEVLERANHAIKHARMKAMESKTAKPVELALLNALYSRFPQDRAIPDCSQWSLAYSKAMEKVYKQFPDDLDVAALFADAVMNLTPWALWDLRTGQPAEGAKTAEAKAVLDRAMTLAGGKEHPGVLHLYIHLMEMSPAPEMAQEAADALRGLVPDAGHLQHMPSHIDILCGDYRRAISANSLAITADRKYLVEAGALNFYSLYRSHDYHFRIYGAMFAGQSKIALETCTELEASLPEELLRISAPPMANWLESFVSMRFHVLIRFGRWADILALQFPIDRELYCMTTAMLYYARGVALAATGDVPQAELERELFQTAVEKVPWCRTLFNNTCLDILAVASAMLDGEIEYRRGGFQRAFEHLRKSIDLCDALPYDEPWGWMQPPRHAYGALLLEQGHVHDALAVYSADLGLDHTVPRPMQHPNNIWALHGYHECLRRLGRETEMRLAKKQLDLGVALADVPIVSSCFCRNSSTNSKI